MSLFSDNEQRVVILLHSEHRKHTCFERTKEKKKSQKHS